MLREKLKVEFSKKELGRLLISIITIGFVFSFNNWGIDSFDVKTGLLNLVRATILAAVALITHIYVQKLMAKRYKQRIEYQLWSIKKIKTSFIYGGFGDIKTPKRPIPIGIILSLLVAVVSNGAWLFLAVASFEFSRLREKISRRFLLVTDYEESKIALSGPLANIGLAIIFTLLSVGGLNLNQAVQMNLLIALFHLIPIPNLAGAKIWFGGRVLYIFYLVLIVFISLLLLILTPLSALVISAIVAVILTLFFFYHVELKK